MKTKKFIVLGLLTLFLTTLVVSCNQNTTPTAVPVVQEEVPEYFSLRPEIEKTYQFGDRKMDGRTLLLWLGYGESGGYPTTYFWFNPDKDDKRDNQAGYLPPADFLKLLSSAVKMKN